MAQEFSKGQIRKGKNVSAYDAVGAARGLGGRLIRHIELDKIKMDGKIGSYWTSWAAKGGLVENLIGSKKDVYDKNTNVLIPYSHFANANKELLNSSMRGFIGKKGIFLLIDPEAITLNRGIYVFENPILTFVENAVLEMGGKGRADPKTGIAVYSDEAANHLPSSQIRWNYVHDGVWPLMRGPSLFASSRQIIGQYHPLNTYRVLAVVD